jgi:iron complex transport system permease protein
LTTRSIALFIGLALLVTILFLADLLAGPVKVPLEQALSILFGGQADLREWEVIIHQIRLPKALAALLCGAGLSMGGLLTQSLFRNPLTGPDVLGLTSGAGLGVALAIMSGFSEDISITMAASAGAAASFLLITLAADKVGNTTLLILGLMLSAFTSSVISVLQFTTESSKLQQYTIWTLGNISIPSGRELALLSISVPLCLIIGLSSLKSLNASTLGSSYLQSMGLNPKVLRWKVLVATSLVTGTITAICGPITFIGIAGPHLVKQFFRVTDHRLLLPMSALSGAALVLACDLLSQLPGGGSVLPLNAVTALFGAPIVIWVILRSK